MEEECEDCMGTGKAEPECERCEGFGYVDDPDDGGTMICPECNDEDCGTCDGTGYVDIE